MIISKIQTLHFQTLEQRSIFTLCAVLFGAGFLYIFLIGGITYNLAAHETTLHDIQILGSSIGDLESKYIALSGGISPETAFALGFAEPKKEIFAFRKRLVQNGF